MVCTGQHHVEASRPAVAPKEAGGIVKGPSQQRRQAKKGSKINLENLPPSSMSTRGKK